MLTEDPANANRLISLQLPASLDVVSNAFEKDANGAEPMDATPSTSAPAADKSAEANADPASVTRPKHCLDGLPTGAEIGKLQILQSGKVRLVIGKWVLAKLQICPQASIL